MGLSFHLAAPGLGAAPNRTDVACFIGHVARRAAPLDATRRAAPLDAAQRAALREAGWIGGPWAVGEARLQSLLQLPVLVESWDAFTTLFDPQRDLSASPPGEGAAPVRCATPLGAAVRSFFALGGRRAYVVRCGDPWPLVASEPTAAQLLDRVRALLPAWQGGIASGALEPPAWRGLEHLHGLAEPSLVCLPELPELFARPPLPPSAVQPLRAQPEVFAECSEEAPPPGDDATLRRVQAPRVDAAGLADWQRALADVRDFLAQHRRDVLCIAAVPLCHDAARPGAQFAATDPLAWLSRAEANGGSVVLRDAGSEPGGASSAFVQLAWPWLQLRHGDDLPERIEAPDGALAGVLAANALARGTFRSAAGRVLPALVGAVPQPTPCGSDDGPWERLAERVCLFAPQPGGWALQSDVTSTPSSAWRAGGVSRLMAAVLRAARSAGEAQLFEANGPALWARTRRAVEQVLRGFWLEGGLGGASADEAYAVRCDRSTMSQNDLDNGRLKVEVSVLPVAAVERIRVVLALGAAESARPASAGVQEAA